jgi:hypothetical protein
MGTAIRVGALTDPHVCALNAGDEAASMKRPASAGDAAGAVVGIGHAAFA